MYYSFAALVFGFCSIARAVTIDMEGLPDTGLDTSSWETGTAPPIASLVDINDMQIAAKNTLDPADYTYYRAAALDEISMTTRERHGKLSNHSDWQSLSLPSQHAGLGQIAVEWLQLHRRFQRGPEVRFDPCQVRPIADLFTLGPPSSATTSPCHSSLLPRLKLVVQAQGQRSTL